MKENLKHMMIIELYNRQVSSAIQNMIDPMHKKIGWEQNGSQIEDWGLWRKFANLEQN